MRVLRNIVKGIKRYFVYRMGHIVCDDVFKFIFVFTYGLFVVVILIALSFFKINDSFVISVSIYSLVLSFVSLFIFLCTQADWEDFNFRIGSYTVKSFTVLFYVLLALYYKSSLQQINYAVSLVLFLVMLVFYITTHFYQ